MVWLVAGGLAPKSLGGGWLRALKERGQKIDAGGNKEGAEARDGAGGSRGFFSEEAIVGNGESPSCEGEHRGHHAPIRGRRCGLPGRGRLELELPIVEQQHEGGREEQKDPVRPPGVEFPRRSFKGLEERKRRDVKPYG